MYLGGTEALIGVEPPKPRRVVRVRQVKRDWESEPLPREPEVKVNSETVIRLAKEARDRRLAMVRLSLLK